MTSTRLISALLKLLIGTPIMTAGSAPFSTYPDRISLFFCRIICLTAGVTNAGSPDVIVTDLLISI